MWGFLGEGVVDGCGGGVAVAVALKPGSAVGAPGWHWCYWQASQVGSLRSQTLPMGIGAGAAGSTLGLGADFPPAGTALSCPALPVDFSTWVAPWERR